MWTSYVDQYGQTQWAMLPEFGFYFQGLLAAIGTLR